MSYYRTSNTKVSPAPKPTIAPPQTLSDCRIILKRIDDDSTQKKEDLKDIQSKISMLNTRLAEIQNEIVMIEKEQRTLQMNRGLIESHLKQNDVNKSFLAMSLHGFEVVDNERLYVTRCRELIDTYEWTDNDDDDDNDTNKKMLPYDIFDFLKLKFAPLESFTSDEIKKIAHYLKACELVNDEKTTNDDIPHDCDTYAEIIDYANDYDGKYVIGDITGCSCGDDDCSDNYKRYGDVVTKLKYITLDSHQIICNERLD
jgi:hypothetical protein